MNDGPADDTKVGDLLARVAGYGLRDTGSVLTTPLDDRAWGEFLARVNREKLTGLLLAAIKVGDFGVTADQAAMAERLHFRVTTNTLFLEQHMLAAVATLERSGCEPVVLKGPVMARRSYPSAGLRPFRDIDILVPDAKFAAAAEALSAGGYQRWVPELRPGFDQRFAKTVLLSDALGRQIDLHRTIVVGPFGLLINLQDLIADREEISVAGRPIVTLGRSQRFVNACYHAAVGDVPPRLMALRDVAQMLRSEQINHRDVLHLARRWRGLAVVQRAILLTHSKLGDLGPQPILDWARSYKPTWRERMLLAAYLAPRAQGVLKTLAAAFVVKGLRNKCAYLYALAVPGRPFIEHRGLTLASWWSPRARKKAEIRPPGYESTPSPRADH